MNKTLAATIVVLVGSLLTAPAQEKVRSTWGIFEDPDSDCDFRVGKGTLTITVGKDHDLSIERRKMNSPRAMHAADGDFTVEVKVSGSFEPRSMADPARRAYHGAGFFIRRDDKNYVRLDRGTLWDGKLNRAFANFELRVGGKIEQFGNALATPLDNEKEPWLKIQRRGDKFAAFVAQAPGKWAPLGEKTMATGKTLHVGVAAVNSSTENFTPQFSGFELKDNE